MLPFHNAYSNAKCSIKVDGTAEAERKYLSSILFLFVFCFDWSVTPIVYLLDFIETNQSLPTYAYLPDNC